MTRPTTKTDLIEVSNQQYNKLVSLIDSMSDEQICATFRFDISKEKQAHWKRDKNVRDVLVHLDQWHKLVLKWVHGNMNGHEQPFFPNGYNWRTYGELNDLFCRENQDVTFDKAYKCFKSSHQEIMDLINSFSNDELFSKGTYKWVGGTTLGSYFVSVTASHYEWALKKIRKHIKSLKKVK